jgi:hypothetical protein
MSLVLLVTAFLGFNSMTGSEPIQTVISAPVAEEPIATESEVTDETIELMVTKVASEVPDVSLSTEDATFELEFLNSQLESAAVILETLQLIEGKE